MFRAGACSVRVRAWVLSATSDHAQAVWVAYNGTGKDPSYLAPYGGEYTMSTLQWHRSLPFADPFWGAAADYARLFKLKYKEEPSYFSAGASAAPGGRAAGAGLGLQLRCFGATCEAAGEKNAVLTRHEACATLC